MIGRDAPALSASAQSLLAQEREAGFEDEALKQRVLERARAALEQDRPSGVALRSTAVESGALRRHAPRTMLLVAAALGVVGLAVAGTGVYRWSAGAQSPVEQPPAPVAAPQAPVLPTAPVATPATAVAPPADAPSEAPRAAPAESAHPSSIQIYALEAGLLEPARSSIARGDYAGGLAAIAKHQREYPRGQLAEEREALRVRALWGMGQKPAAESAAVTFRKRYPKSALLSWMKEPAK